MHYDNEIKFLEIEIIRIENDDFNTVQEQTERNKLRNEYLQKFCNDMKMFDEMEKNIMKAIYRNNKDIQSTKMMYSFINDSISLIRHERIMDKCCENELRDIDNTSSNILNNLNFSAGEKMFYRRTTQQTIEQKMFENTVKNNIMKKNKLQTRTSHRSYNKSRRSSPIRYNSGKKQRVKQPRNRGCN